MTRFNVPGTRRKDLANAVAAWVGEEARYTRAPSYSYQIGNAYVIDREGSLCPCVGTDVESTERLLQHLYELGFETVDPEASEEVPAAPEDSCVSFPLNNVPALQLSNLLRTLYVRQGLINAMTKSDLLFIDPELIMLLADEKPETTERVVQLLKSEINAGLVKGIKLEEDRLSIAVPTSQGNTIQYAELLMKIANAAFQATRVSCRKIEPAESEMKYFCNTWLNQLGFSGREHKELREVLMGHLKGYAAFRTADKMAAHREKYSKHGQNEEGADNETDG